MKRNYLNQKEVVILENNGTLLQSEQIIDKIYNDLGHNVSVKFRKKVIDYRENPLAPEQFAYSISWECQFSGNRGSAIYYPNTVGLQFTK